MVLREYGSGGHILESLGGAWVSNVIFFVVFPSYHCPFGQAFSSLVFYLRHLLATLASSAWHCVMCVRRQAAHPRSRSLVSV